MSIKPEGLMSTSRTDDFVPQRPSRPTDNDVIIWDPRLGFIRADHARHLYDDSAPEGEQRHLSAMHLDPAREGDCCGDDCGDGDEREDTSSSGIAKIEGLLGRGDEDIDETEEETEKPVYTRADMARVAEAVEGVAERFGDLLEEHRELRQIVKDQQAQIEALVAALRARKRDEDLTNEDKPSEDVETEAEDLPPMLN
jgi:hypothetical protein